jgi:hypothetical protein
MIANLTRNVVNGLLILSALIQTNALSAPTEAEDCPVLKCNVCLGQSQDSGDDMALSKTSSYTESGPFYNTGGHYSSAYVIAIAAGMTESEADELTYWTEYPDRDGRYDAIKGMLSWDLGHSVQVWLHSLRGGDAAPVRASLENLLSQKMGKPWAWGLLVHALGDSYAHSYLVESNDSTEQQHDELYSWPFGHAFAGHEPDVIANHKQKYKTYLEALYRALQQPDRKPRQCLLDRLESFVDCQEWDAKTDEVGALNCFSSHQKLPKRPLPFLDLTLSPESVDQWIEMVKMGMPGQGEQ